MKDQAKEHYCRERLAKWLIENGYSTGHGDTFEDLIEELIDQIEQNALKGIFYVSDEEIPF